MTHEQIVQRVRGKAGSKVTLTVLREGRSTPLHLTITRAHIQVPQVAWHMLPGTQVAHVALQEFGEQAATEMAKAIDSARKEGARGILIDLRVNPGGLK